MYSAPADDRSGPPSRVSSSRSLGASSGVLRDLSPRRSSVSSASTSYASAASSFGSEHGSDAGSAYALSRTSSARSSDSAWTFYSKPHSEVGSVADASIDDIVEQMSQASARYSNASVASSGHSTHSSSRIEVDPNSGKARYADRSSSSSKASEVLSEAGDLPPYRRSLSIGGGRSSVGSDVSSHAASAASSPTPSRRRSGSSSATWSETGSFHLSDHSSIGAALATRRMGYSSDSSRRLTSDEGPSKASSVPPSVHGSQYSIAPSYRASLTPSSEFAVRAALAGGRFNRSDSQTDRRSSVSASTVSSLHLSEENDRLTPLPPSRFRPVPESVSNAPSEIRSALNSSRLSTALSSSRRLGATGIAPRVARADIEALSNASVLEGNLRPAGRRNPQISPDEFWAFLDK